ncbi:UNVERIFIED_CONTAM: hypothetical protein RMT77_007140 [Armadillidium vulgare]
MLRCIADELSEYNHNQSNHCHSKITDTRLEIPTCLKSRNLVESSQLEEIEKSNKSVPDSVFEHIRSVDCEGHTHFLDGRWHHNFKIEMHKRDSTRDFQTTGRDYGNFPRGSEDLGRPPCMHSLNTRFTKHLADSGMFRNHSMNM